MSKSLYAAVAVMSGFAALIYQVSWQRLLFTLYGTASEATAIILAVFMFGLGVGAGLGGIYATRPQARLLLTFALCEVTTAAFGTLTSLCGVAWSAALGGTGPQAALVGSALVLLIPTACMGASLPLLAAYALRFDQPAGHLAGQRAGRAVARFYSANTLGAAFGSLACALVLYELFGLRQTLLVAVGLNVAAAVLVGVGLGGRARRLAS